MKKIISIMIIILIIMSIPVVVKATENEMNKLKLKVIDANEQYDIYMLLPKKYIKYAIQHDGLDIEYDGANTLKYNTIPSITVNINNIEDEVYTENAIEYVQVKLDDLGGEEYLFEIISEYTDMDMVYRVKSSTKDNIMAIENFKIQDNKCEIEYNYDKETIKTQKEKNVTIKFNLEWWQVAIAVILIVFITYIYRRAR